MYAERRDLILRVPVFVFRQIGAAFNLRIERKSVLIAKPVQLDLLIYVFVEIFGFDRIHIHSIIHPFMTHLHRSSANYRTPG
jgi:hypothetical protein